MNIEEYQKIIEQTAIYPKQVNNFGLAYCYLGLLGELNEFDEACDIDNTEEAVKKEAGDVLWYITAFCIEADINLSDVWNYIERGETLPTIPELAEYIKKYYRDNKSLNKELFVKCLKRLIHYMEFTWYEYFDTTLDWNEIRQINYDKLIARRTTNTLHGDGDNREVTE